MNDGTNERLFEAVRLAYQRYQETGPRSNAQLKCYTAGSSAS